MIRTLNGLGGNDTTTNVYVNTAFASGEATEVEQQSNTTQAKVNLAFKSNTTQATSVNNNDLILIADNATGKIVKYVEANLVGQTLTATLPLVISNDVISTNFTKSSTDTLTNKTITSFTGGSSATITTPSTTGTLALTSDIPSLSGTTPITFDSATGAIGTTFTSSSTDTLTNKTITSFTGGSSATITTPSTTGTIALTSDIPNLTGQNPITFDSATGAIGTTFTPTSTTSMSGKSFSDTPNFNNGVIIVNSTTSTATSNSFISFNNSSGGNLGFTGVFGGDVYLQNYTSGKNIILDTAGTGQIRFNDDTRFKASGTNNFNSGIITNLSTINTHTIPSGTGTFALTSQIIDPINSINFGTNTSTTGTRTLGISTENTNINGDIITIQGQSATNLRSTNSVNINGTGIILTPESSAGVIFNSATNGTYHGIDVKDNAIKNSLLNGKVKFNSDLDVISKNIHIRTDVDTANLKNAKIFFNSTNGSLEYAKMGLFNDDFTILQSIAGKDLILSNQPSSGTAGSIRVDGDMKCEEKLFFRDAQNGVDKSEIFMDGDNLKIQTINAGNTDIEIIPTGSGKIKLLGDTQYNSLGTNDFNSSSITNLGSIEGGLNLKNGNTSAGFIDFFETSSTGTNKITLKPHTNSIASDYTITLPDSGGQMILDNTTDTFSNKSFSDVINFVISTTNTASVGLNGSNLRLQALTGNSDVQLVASGNGKIAFTGNTEFFSASTINANSSNITNIASLNTHPLPSGSSELVDLNSTQTLTNKSISYSQLTGTPTIPTNNNQLTNGANYITANSTDTLTNKNFGDNVDITGQLKITRVGQALILKGVGTGNANVVGMDIQDTTNTRKGFIGNFDSSTSDIWVYADAGNIRLRGTDKVRVLSNKLAIGSQSGTTDPKQAILQSPASITADYTLDLPSSAGTLALSSEIPTNNNQLTNGANYITASSTDTLTNKSISYSQLTGTPTIPTNNNQLTNGANYITASSTDTLTNKDFEGNVDISGGTLKIEKLAQALILKGKSSGNANVVYMEIQDSGNVRKGFIGDADSASSDIWMYADAGNIRLRGTDKVRVLSNKLAIGSQSGTTDPKQAILQSPSSITADYTLDLPSSAGTLALTSDIPTGINGFTLSGNTPNKEATAPSSNDYIFSSGGGSNGNCRVIIKSDTDNTSSEDANCQILFSKENDAVQGSIGLGTPSSTTDDNDLIINSNFTDKGIIFKTQGTERFKINPTSIQSSIKFLPLEVFNSTTGGGYIDFFEKTTNGTNKIRLKVPDAVSANATLTLPTTAGTLGLEANEFSITGSNPNKEANAPSCNDYIFSSGNGGNGSCRVIIKSDTNNTSDETNNCQVLFSKEGDAVQGSIGMGIPGSTINQNDMNIDSTYTGSSIFLKTQSVERMKISPNIITASVKDYEFKTSGDEACILTLKSGTGNNSSNKITKMIFDRANGQKTADITLLGDNKFQFSNNAFGVQSVMLLDTEGLKAEGNFSYASNYRAYTFAWRGLSQTNFAYLYNQKTGGGSPAGNGWHTDGVADQFVCQPDMDVRYFNTDLIGNASTSSYSKSQLGDIFCQDVFGETINYTALNNASDARLKKNLKPIENATDTLKKLNPLLYDKKVNEEDDLWGNEYEKDSGFIAQDVYNEIPELRFIVKNVAEDIPENFDSSGNLIRDCIGWDIVEDEPATCVPAEDASGNPNPNAGEPLTEATYKKVKNPNKKLAINYEELTAYLVKGFQEQQTEIENLKNIINQLTSAGSFASFKKNLT
jgi:hypothetical protein